MWTCKCGNSIGFKKPNLEIIVCMLCGKEESMRDWMLRSTIKALDLNQSPWAKQYKVWGGQLYNNVGEAIKWFGAKPWEGGETLEGFQAQYREIFQ